MKGEDLVKICSMYENYKFRTPQRLLNASSTRQLEETAGQTLRRTVRHGEQICQDCHLVDGTGSEETRYRRHPTGTLQIKCGEDVDDAGVICRLRRCRIGDEKKVYKHSEPPLMVTSNRLPPIPKQIHGKESRTPAELNQSKSKEPRGTSQDTQEAGRAGEHGRQDDGVTGSEGNNKGKKVSFGGARIVDDRWLTNTWAAHCANQSLQLKHPSSRYKVLGEEISQDSKVLLPRRGRLHVRFSGKRGRPVHPATARLKAEDSRGMQATLPLTGVSILKPAKPLMVIPTPCFPCSPEFERTFKSLRDQNK